MASRTLLDPQSGCLTTEALRLLESAAPGQVPPGIATHFAQCARCQQRALAPLREKNRKERPHVWRNLILAMVAGAVLMMGLAALAR